MLLITSGIHRSRLICYHLTPGLINIPHHQGATLGRQSCTNLWKRLQQQQQRLNCADARQIPSLPVRGPLVEHTCTHKTTIRRQAWSSLATDSCCDLTSCLLGFGGTDVPTWPRWHRSLLTSLRGEESRCKAWNQTAPADLPITVDNICRLTTKVKLLFCVWASELSANGNEIVTHPQLLSTGFAWAGVQLHTRSSLWERL